MKVVVTGGSGFIGNHVVKELLQRGLKVIVVGRDINKVKQQEWFDRVEFVKLDISQTLPDQALEQISATNKLIHLAWDGLPNYMDLIHFEETLIFQYNFLKKIIHLGVKDITITGTCFEYGMKNGCLTTDMPSDPQNPYALAKDTLRKSLEHLQKKINFELKWVRLFYMYGKGQSEKSILSQLDRALAEGKEIFNMSAGEQLRDYLPVEDVAKEIVEISLIDKYNGIINCCSGIPVSIRSLVENHIKNSNKNITLNLGYYPYPDYEPLAFWGKPRQ
jgi:nucleoside-diphosphate-sugar epimerase